MINKIFSSENDNISDKTDDTEYSKNEKTKKKLILNSIV